MIPAMTRVTPPMKHALAPVTRNHRADHSVAERPLTTPRYIGTMPPLGREDTMPVATTTVVADVRRNAEPIVED